MSTWAILPGSSLDAVASNASEDEELMNTNVDSKRFLEGLWSDNEEEEPAAAKSATPGLVHSRPDGDSETAQSVQTPRNSQRKSQLKRYFTEDSSDNKSKLSKRVRLACYLCGSAAHSVSKCPHELCFICLKPGHHSHECPSHGRPVVCGLCGRLGHERRACPESSQTAPDLSLCRCIACGEHGHVDCSPFERRPKQLSCSNCGSLGHAAPSCQCDGMDRWHRLFTSAWSSNSYRGSETNGNWQRGKGSSKGSWQHGAAQHIGARAGRGMARTVRLVSSGVFKGAHQRGAILKHYGRGHVATQTGVHRGDDATSLGRSRESLIETYSAWDNVLLCSRCVLPAASDQDF
eukprot:1432815-Pleurochrysis_carterae.AAC.4